MNCGGKMEIYICITPDGIRTRNRAVCRQVINPLDYRVVRFLSVHSILTTVKYMFVSIKSSDLKIQYRENSTSPLDWLLCAVWLMSDWLQITGWMIAEWMMVSSNRSDHSNRSVRSTFRQSYHDLNDLYKKRIVLFSEIVKWTLQTGV